jgi:3'(2'), 5'-bisphosphate nucleotidase
MSLDSLLPQLLGARAVTAMLAVAEAGDLAEQIRREGVDVRTKSDGSPTTVADFAVQALVAARLATALPDIPLLAEEDTAQLRDATAAELKARTADLVRRFDPRMNADLVLASIDRGCGTPGQAYWTLDPIDGTKGFLGGRQYAIALALVQGADVTIGILGCPRLSLRGASIAPAGSAADDSGIAIAVRGRGAWWVLPRAREITRLFVSTVSDPSRARVLHSFESAHSDMSRLGRVRHALGVRDKPLLLDSQAKHVLLAAHRADLILRFPTGPGHDAIWDHAAGALLVTEAGGHVTDLAGQRLDFSTGRRLFHNRGLIASNGWLHDAALRAIEASHSCQTSASC